MQQRLLQASTVSPFLGICKISRKGMKSNAKDNAANITSINKRQGPNICSTVLRYQRAVIRLLISDELSLILQACCLHRHVQACSISSDSALTGGTRREPLTHDEVFLTGPSHSSSLPTGHLWQPPFFWNHLDTPEASLKTCNFAAGLVHAQFDTMSQSAL